LSLAGVLSCQKNDGFAYISLFIDRLTNHQTLYHSFWMGFANIDFCYKFLKFRCFVGDVSIKFFQSVWIGMCDKKFVLFAVGRDLEAKFIIHSSWILAINYSFFIAYLSSLSSPTFLNAQNSLILCKGVNSGSHSIIKQRVRFGEIYYIESVIFADFHFLYWKVKPLVISLRVCIVLHHKVILQIPYLPKHRFTLKTANKFPLSKWESKTKSPSPPRGKGDNVSS